MDDACRKGDLESVQAMCAADARRAGEPDAGGVTPLHRAAAGNHVEVCEFLVESRANINAVDRYLETPLKRAVYNGHVDVLIALLEMGADLNFPDSQGKMVIHHAAEQGHLQCVEMMLEKGASVNAEVVGYLTPLHFAAMNGHTGCVRVLIEAGALLDAQGGQSNQAALHMAAEGGHTSTVRVLLEEGADVELEDSQGRRPALCSADRKTRDVFDGFVLRHTCHPASCTVSGPGITPTTEACDVVRFVIQPRDANNRELRDPGGLIVFTVEIQDRTTGEVQEAHVEPCPEFFNSLCYWDASRAGQYAVHVRQDNALPDGVTSGPGSSMPIGGSPFHVDVKPSKLDPYCTRAAGKGVTRTEAAVTAEFTVFGRDRFNNPCPEQEITVLIDPNNRVPVDLNVEDLGNGDYKVTYTAPHSSGLVRISVAIDGGKHIFNSPFATLISPGDAFPPNCEVAGAGLFRGGCGMDVNFIIHARDAAGNHLIDGGLAWAIKVYPEDAGGAVMKIDCEITDYNNGVYACKFRPIIAGKHTVRVLLNNKHVRGSPFAPCIYEMPDWECEEVAQFVEQIGYPQYRASFVNQDIRGFALSKMDQDMLEHELGIYLKGHQTRILGEIRKIVANDAIEEDEEITVLQDAELVRLGVSDPISRRNIRLACADDMEKSRLATDPDHEDIVFRRLKLELYGHGEELQETLRDVAEVAVSTTSQEILTELYSGRTKDAFGISRALRTLEATLKQQVENKIRAATIVDEEGEEGGEEGSRPATGES